jgi:hypothetical protein
MIVTKNTLNYSFVKTQRTAPHRQPTAPTVSRPLKDLDVKEGQPIQLTCQVQGFPKSEVCLYDTFESLINFLCYLASLV